MRIPFATLAAPALLVAAAHARFVIYADEWHPTRPTNPEDRAGVDHVVLAFAMANATAAYQPKVPISTIKSEFPNAKVMIAVGGWGDDIGFNQVSKSDATITQFAADVATMLTNTGADGVDIDWEYPGGNGANYKQVHNSEKEYQIAAFPKMLAAIRAAIGNKLLSIAVPGKKGDMIAYTKTNGPKIWPSVDYINVMSYDLMNRRDNITKHHTSVADSLQTINNYLAIGAPPAKMNLGFAYYAKYFTTKDTCPDGALGCPIVLAEDPVTGKDLLTSGAYTFETTHMTPVNASQLTTSYDGTCGPEKLTKCSSGCCSQYGNCGTSPEHCSGACQHAFGTGCTDPDVAGSWQKALQHGTTDAEAGGQYYFDVENKLFWTWDTPELMQRKFRDIVSKKGLGGVMAWSLGEDSFDWRHVRLMAKEAGKTGGYETKKPQAQSASVDGDAHATGQPSSSSQDAPKGGWRTKTKKPYDVVWVDGSKDGPEGEDDVEDEAPEYEGPASDDGKKGKVPVVQVAPIVPEDATSTFIPVATSVKQPQQDFWTPEPGAPMPEPAPRPEEQGVQLEAPQAAQPAQQQDVPTPSPSTQIIPAPQEVSVPVPAEQASTLPPAPPIPLPTNPSPSPSPLPPPPTAPVPTPDLPFSPEYLEIMRAAGLSLPESSVSEASNARPVQRLKGACRVKRRARGRVSVEKKVAGGKGKGDAPNGSW